MGFYGLPTPSEELQPFRGDPRSSTATLPDSYLKNILDTFQKPDLNDLYDLSTVPSPTGDGKMFFNTIDMHMIRPDSPMLHGKAAAIVAAVVCTETEPLVLPRNDELEPCEAMVTIIHTILNRLNEDDNEDPTITVVLMDTSYDLRLAAMGYRMPCSKIVLSFCSLDLHHIQDPHSTGARLLHSQVQNIMSSISVPSASRSTESSPDPYPGCAPRLRRRSPSRGRQSFRRHLDQRSVSDQDVDEETIPQRRCAYSLPPRTLNVHRQGTSIAFQALQVEDTINSIKTQSSRRSISAPPKCDESLVSSSGSIYEPVDIDTDRFESKTAATLLRWSYDSGVVNDTDMDDDLSDSYDAESSEDDERNSEAFDLDDDFSDSEEFSSIWSFERNSKDLSQDVNRLQKRLDNLLESCATFSGGTPQAPPQPTCLRPPNARPTAGAPFVGSSAPSSAHFRRPSVPPAGFLFSTSSIPPPPLSPPLDVFSLPSIPAAAALRPPPPPSSDLRRPSTPPVDFALPQTLPLPLPPRPRPPLSRISEFSDFQEHPSHGIDSVWPPTTQLGSTPPIFERTERKGARRRIFNRPSPTSSVDVCDFLYGPKWKKHAGVKRQAIDQNLSTARDTIGGEKNRSFKAHSDSCKRLHSFATPQNPVETILSGKRLYPREVVQVGTLCKSTYQAVNGSIVIQIQNKFRKNPSDITVYGECGISEGILPFVAAGASTSISRPGYSFISGEPALTKVLVEIKRHPNLRKWFLSCMIRGTILLNKQSTSDGFVPSRVSRLIHGGIVMNDRLPLWFFHEIGGALATIGDKIVFKCHSDAQSHEVMHIDDEGILHIGKQFQQKLHHQNLNAILWTGIQFSIGRAAFR